MNGNLTHRPHCASQESRSEQFRLGEELHRSTRGVDARRDTQRLKVGDVVGRDDQRAVGRKVFTPPALNLNPSADNGKDDSASDSVAPGSPNRTPYHKTPPFSFAASLRLGHHAAECTLGPCSFPCSP